MRKRWLNHDQADGEMKALRSAINIGTAIIIIGADGAKNAHGLLRDDLTVDGHDRDPSRAKRDIEAGGTDSIRLGCPYYDIKFHLDLYGHGGNDTGKYR